MVVQPGLCRTWSEAPKTGFLTTRLICAVERAGLSLSWSKTQGRFSLGEAENISLIFVLPGQADEERNGYSERSRET